MQYKFFTLPLSDSAYRTIISGLDEETIAELEHLTDRELVDLYAGDWA